MIVLLCYKHVMQTEGETSKVDGAWRIAVGLSLIPACATLYQRLTLPESRRYEESKRIEEDDASIVSEKDKGLKEKDGAPSPTATGVTEHDGRTGQKELAKAKKAHFMEFIAYFSEWQHFKILLGTCTCWFLLDIAYAPSSPPSSTTPT